ncbi:alpha-galactosidase [Paenibacillus sp. FSL M8-0228]|uniref:alpha-galactosidase n=1 Tax=Paenibacillus TaxID=44249 RepID=UPI00083E2A89|nr:MULTISPECIES: alpha-galactosidase [Paenibacillus]MBO3282846.1 alpha-galactosidase [Paenibacillus polymyxa]MBP1309669.1 alpha-galactosidase [Paenibacillus sp. 1182]ODB55860.1 alpha-galactosidase [Paenibacillus polymyxa]
MAIYIDKEKLLFHLQGSNTSYVMQVIRGGYLSHLYWGKKIQNYRGSNKIIFMDRGFSPNPDGEDRAFSLDTIPQEYPSFGNSDFRIPAYQIQLENGSTVTDFRYKEHRVFQGKPKLKGLPSTYAEDDGEVATLEIVLEDPLIDVKVVLSYSLYQKRDVITRSVRFENEGRQQLKLLRALSASVDFRDDEYELITLYGAHNNEKNIARRKIVPGIQMVDSCRGASSPQQAPFMALVRKGTDEEQGEVYAFNLVYSGNFTAQTQVDSYRNTRITMGINPFDFTWLLEPEESFQTPEVVMVYTENGLGGMSRIYHDLYRNRLCRGPFRDKERPILINNWEATYFNFDANKIEQLAKEAQSVGVELFVLDDGWFGKRDDDNTSLGDWVVDRRKLPDGLPDLANRIRNLGMEFGLWFEPEMVSIDSDLYRKHPDWCIHVPDRPYTLGRNQLMLDLSRKEVCEYVIKSVSDILSDVPITYVKWDMNRHMTDVGSAALPPERQRETAHRYILGLYNIMEELTSKFPNVLFESCSSGGGRFDAGMLYYMPQTWTSDNTDAICRLKIQWGTSLVYPPITMGAHVSTVPNHQVGRITPLETRGYVAMAGNLGYELDLTTLTIEEKEVVKKQIALYKEMRSLIQFGNFYRMINPFDENEAAWSFVSEDQTEMAASYFKVLSQPAAAIKTLKFKGLNPDYVYRNVETGELFGGDELMHVGITLARVKQDFLGMFWRFVKEEI